MRSRLLLMSAIVALLAFGAVTVTPSASYASTTDNITTGPPEDLGLGCPSPSGAPQGIQVWLRVVKWCGLPAVHGQAQFKLQLRIYNKGKHTLGIGLEHLRLIVARFDLAKWKPPTATYERPSRITVENQRFWAIPPNGEDAAEPNPLPGEPDNYTFATHWGQTRLGPGQVFNPSFHHGDLVFYVPYLPHDPRGVATRNDVLGMAYVVEGELVVMCPKERWKKESAEDF
jgi:hypothetical protein